jgi:hypothetical protein
MIRGLLTPIPEERRGTGRQWHNVRELYSFDPSHPHVDRGQEHSDFPSSIANPDLAHEVRLIENDQKATEVYFERVLSECWDYSFSFFKEKSELKAGIDLCGPCETHRSITREIFHVSQVPPEDVIAKRLKKTGNIKLWTVLSAASV